MPFRHKFTKAEKKAYAKKQQRMREWREYQRQKMLTKFHANVARKRVAYRGRGF